MLILIACISTEAEYQALRERAMDWDQDGDRALKYGGTDCNDDDPTVYGGAPELCSDSELVDEDCDGEVDEGLQKEWFYDEDNDGWFSDLGFAGCNPSQAGEAVAAPGGDCNDSDALVNPGEPEVAADGVDSNCDDQELCFLDADGDGFGTTTVESEDLSCEGTDESTVGTDCDDGDASIHPGAAETPADGVDQDCDGAEVCFADLDGDGFGGSEVLSEDMDCTDSGEFGDALDCNDADAQIAPGQTEVCWDGVDNDCDGSRNCTYTVESVGHLLYGGEDANAGRDLVVLGDTDLNGMVEFATVSTATAADRIYWVEGSPEESAALDTFTVVSDDEVSVWGLHGGFDAVASTANDLLVWAEVDGELAVIPLSAPYDPERSLLLNFDPLTGPLGTDFGHSMAGYHQAGSARASFVVSAATLGDEEEGRVYFFQSWSSGDAEERADGSVSGVDAWLQLGAEGIALGDVDGDGVADLAVGSSHSETAAERGGEAWIFLGPLTNSLDTTMADTNIPGTVEVGRIGDWLEFYDLDSDGTDELLVGGFRDSARVVADPAISGDSEIRFTNYWWESVDVRPTAAGDTDGDGVQDLLLCVDNQFSADDIPGAAYLLMGPTSGVYDVDDADITLLGQGEMELSTAAGHADLDGDGLSDLLLTAPAYDRRGGIFVVYAGGEP